MSNLFSKLFERMFNRHSIKNEDKKIAVVDENGETKICDIICTFSNDDTKRSYVIYTDYSSDGDSGTNIFAGIYHPKEQPEFDVIPIQTEKEWEIVREVIDELKNTIGI